MKSPFKMEPSSLDAKPRGYIEEKRFRNAEIMREAY
jgi:hypothetical protein